MTFLTLTLIILNQLLSSSKPVRLILPVQNRGEWGAFSLPPHLTSSTLFGRTRSIHLRRTFCQNVAPLSLLVYKFHPATNHGDSPLSIPSCTSSSWCLCSSQTYYRRSLTSLRLLPKPLTRHPQHLPSRRRAPARPPHQLLIQARRVPEICGGEEDIGRDENNEG